MQAANNITLLGAFTVRNPEIDYLSSNSGDPGVPISITGKFFGSKKPKVYLEYINSKGKSRKRYCHVTSWIMNPNTNESSIEFIVPETPRGYESGSSYPLKVRNRVGTTAETIYLTIN